MDIFNIYNKVLTQNEVSFLYNNATTEQKPYCMTFPEEPQVQVLLLDQNNYVETQPL